MFVDDAPSVLGESSVWYYAYVFDKNIEYPYINGFSFYPSSLSNIHIYINPYDDDINNLDQFIHVGSNSDDGIKYRSYLFTEPVKIVGDKFAVIIKYETYSYRLFYREVSNRDNVYIYRNDKWEKTEMIPYFNLYGYKM